MSDVIRYGIVVILTILFLADVFFLKITGKQLREQIRKGARVPRRVLVLLNLLSLTGICLVVMVVMVISGWS